jgi:hypothetical protein
MDRAAFEEMIVRQAFRLADGSGSSDVELARLLPQDLESATPVDPSRPSELDGLLAELNGMTGRAGVKREVSEPAAGGPATRLEAYRHPRQPPPLAGPDSHAGSSPR